MLENDRVAVRFAPSTGSITTLVNKLTGEVYSVRGDEFLIDAVEFRIGAADVKLESIGQEGHRLTVRYRHDPLTVEVSYELKVGQHFAQKRLAITSREPYRLKRLVVSRPAFSAAGLHVVAYPYQKNVTYFGRTPRGGFFTGVELPFDDSSVDSRRVTLAYRPSLKVGAGERLQSEPVYFGVYRRGDGDDE